LFFSTFQIVYSKNFDRDFYNSIIAKKSNSLTIQLGGVDYPGCVIGLRPEKFTSSKFSNGNLNQGTLQGLVKNLTLEGDDI